MGEGVVMANIVRGERVCERGRLGVGCSAAVFEGGKLLLVRRADNGLWTVPGGYMEPGECLTEACAREVMEEAGIQVRVGRLIAVYTSPHVLLEYPDGNSFQLVMLHFLAERIGGELSPSEETTDVAYFAREEIKQMELSGLTRMRIDDSFTDSVEALVRDDYELR